jgi:predicted alpha/beta hydrolase
MDTLTLHTADGHTLAARCFTPEGEVRRVVVIATALGVPQMFYWDHARWLAEHGYAVITFDWRGMGLSAPQTLKGYRADLLDWAQRDAPAVLAEATRRFPGVPITWFGHSMGGILFGAIPPHTVVDRVVTMAAGHGHRDLLARPLRYYVGLMWNVLMPWSIKRHGYFAGRRYNVVGDMPAGVALQWRRWAQHPDYMVSDSPQLRQAYAEVRTPMTVVMVNDDQLATNEGVRRLHAHYTQAPQMHVRLSPREHGVRRLGHFDFFRAARGKTMWPLALDWLG